jgi:hypothetical protein
MSTKCGLYVVIDVFVVRGVKDDGLDDACHIDRDAARG